MSVTTCKDQSHDRYIIWGKMGGERLMCLALQLLVVQDPY